MPPTYGGLQAGVEAVADQHVIERAGTSQHGVDPQDQLVEQARMDQVLATGPCPCGPRRVPEGSSSVLALDRLAPAWFDVQLMHSDDDAPAAARRGRPRSEKARLAILEAAAELLLDRGLSAVSMDAVAERAGVSKATIYRWWHTKEALALDALYNEWAAARPPARDTGSLRGDLLSLLRPWVRLAVSRPYGRVIAALVTEAQTDPAFAAEYRARFVEPRRAQAAAVFRSAIERGEIPADTKIEVALDLVYGPVYHRLLHGHAPLNDRFVRDVVDAVLGGIMPGAAPARR